MQQANEIKKKNKTFKIEESLALEIEKDRVLEIEGKGC